MSQERLARKIWTEEVKASAEDIQKYLVDGGQTYGTRQKIFEIKSDIDDIQEGKKN